MNANVCIGIMAKDSYGRFRIKENAFLAVVPMRFLILTQWGILRHALLKIRTAENSPPARFYFTMRANKLQIEGGFGVQFAVHPPLAWDNRLLLSRSAGLRTSGCVPGGESASD